jgi:hypothetical protein
MRSFNWNFFQVNSELQQDHKAECCILMVILITDGPLEMGKPLQCDRVTREIRVFLFVEKSAFVACQ